MGTYIGTNMADTITPFTVSAGVTADPAGSKPSDAADTIKGLGGNDNLSGGGGGDTIDGGTGNDSIFTSGPGNSLHGGDGDDSVFVGIQDLGGANPATNTAWGDDGNDRVELIYSLGGEQFRWEGQQPTGTITLHGGAGNDYVGIYGSVDTFNLDMAGTTAFLYGEAGNDHLYASSYDPNSDGSPYRGHNPDFLYGGTGSDSYYVFETKDVAIEKPGQGYDTVDANGTDYTLGANIEKLVMSYNYMDYPGPEGFHGTGNALDNLIIGSDRNETLDGAGGNDKIFGSPHGGDLSNGMVDEDIIHGGAGNDLIYGAGDGGPAMADGGDELYGNDGNDRIFGSLGDDLINGGAGSDALAGQGDSDTLYGGGGNDRFVYEDIADSKPGAGNHDTILDMAGIGVAGGDRIDLHQIDADVTKGGNQAFVFVSPTATLKAGQVHVVAGGGTASLVQGEVDGKAGVDFEILVQDDGSKPGDWIAGDFIL